jgi:dCMP deaminase
MIIGLTGMFASGKDSVAEYLMKKGFKHISLSDMLRDELNKRKVEITRDNLIAIGNELREKHGHGVLGERAFDCIRSQQGDFVVTSIRHPAEVKSLKKHGHFFLVEVRSPIKDRFKRIKQRNRENDPKTLEDLKSKEKIESQQSGPGQQLTNTIKMAQAVLNNDKTIKELQKKADKLVEDLRKKTEKLSEYVRPSWDEYFMGIVDAVAKRATCDRGRTAVVLVKDKRIISTGYVGSPMGAPHCDEIGHLMKKVTHEDGTISQHCMRTNHAEMNAVALAARNGVTVDGATLYCKLAPCYTCAKMVINAGITRIVCQKRYHADKESMELFKLAGMQVEVLDNTVEAYKNQ